MRDKLKVRVRQILKTQGKNKNMMNNLNNYLFNFGTWREQITKNSKFFSIINAIDQDNSEII